MTDSTTPTFEERMRADHEELQDGTINLRRSLYGFEESAVRVTLGKQMDNLEGSELLRALAFILKRREGLPDDEAKEAAVNTLSFGEVQDMVRPFATPYEPMPSDPVTEAGKADSPTE